MGSGVGNLTRWTPTICARVDEEIRKHIEPVAWERCRVVDAAERESMSQFLDKWEDHKGKGKGAST